MPEQQQRSLRDSLYLTDNPDETTFKYDDQLPPLPVPTVRQSVMKLLDTIKPVAQDEQSFRELQKKAQSFIEDSNVNQLQELLKKRASKNKNWLEAWWLEFAYLRSRKPLIPYSNMAAPLPVMPYWPIVSSAEPAYADVRAKRAALSTHFQLCFWRMLRDEQMRPMIHKGVPWSMAQFKYLFNTIRLPGDQKDQLFSWFRTLKQGLPESTEIIVLHRGYVFAIQPVSIHGQGYANILTAPQIERQLKYIEQWAADRPYGPGVGALTTCERSEWTEARQRLAGIRNNQKLLDRLERALSVLVLDDNEPQSQNEIFRQSMCGDPRNRWADKSISSIAFKNGTFGANADHTPYDGFCTAIMTHYLMTSVQECNGIWIDSMSDAASKASWVPYTEPELLNFDLDAQLKKQIDEAREQFDRIASTIDTLHETFKHFGKALLKEHRFHPEAFVQTAIHSAYYKQYNRMAPAYVTASTRKFHNGRTETCRSCYPEMHEFAKFLAQNGPSKPKEAYELLKQTVHRFQTLMEEASNGQGCDRHLMGLYLTAMLEGKQIPELFEEELVQKTNNYILSTSLGGYWNVCGGVPPLVDEGYGCFYGIEDNAITFCCTAYKPCPETDLKTFYSNLSQALVDMQKILLGSKL